MPYPFDVVVRDDCSKEEWCFLVAVHRWSFVSLDSADGVNVAVFVEVKEESWYMFTAGECPEEEFFEGYVRFVLGSLVFDEKRAFVDSFSEE